MARRREPGTTRQWTSLVGNGVIGPNDQDTQDLILPAWRPSGNDPKQEVTLLRIRGWWGFMPAERPESVLSSDVPDAADWQVVLKGGIWADPSIEPDHNNAESIADQGLLWQSVLMDSVQWGRYDIGPSAPDVQGIMNIRGPCAYEHFDIKSMRKFKRFHEVNQFTQDLTFVAERPGTEGQGLSQIDINWYLSVRMLWLVR